MMDHSLASLVTQERDDYFGRFFHSLGARRPQYSLTIRQLQVVDLARS